MACQPWSSYISPTLPRPSSLERKHSFTFCNQASIDTLHQSLHQPTIHLEALRGTVCRTATHSRLVLNMTAVIETSNDDTFKLYDLHVEVICPPGERILCGAKNGDSFRLEGEMLYLPPGQGFSIYSLGMSIFVLVTSPGYILSRRCNAATGSKATDNTSQRLDVDRCRHRLPRSKLQVKTEDLKAGAKVFQSC